MALFRRFFYRKPPDRLLEISERVYVFDCCFSTDVLDEDEYSTYMNGIVAQLQDHYPDGAFMVFNFKEGDERTQLSDLLSQYAMTVMDYPQQYERCPLLPLEMIHHFLRSSESWLSIEGQQNVLLMHCEKGGWPVLAFMLASLLLYRKQYTGEQKTLEMVYKQAPRELLHLLTPLNPQPSQLRYLQYISRRNFRLDWPSSNAPLALDCIVLRFLPLYDGGRGCRPVVRVYGQDTSSRISNISSKLLLSTSKVKKHLHLYSQEECDVVKLDIHCCVQGDVVLECIHLEDDLLSEEIIFRIMFHTEFIRSNVLILTRDEVDVLWDAKDKISREFRAELLFSDVDSLPTIITSGAVSEDDDSDTDLATPEEFFEAEEIFSSFVEGQDVKGESDNQTIEVSAQVDESHHEVAWNHDIENRAFEECAIDEGKQRQGNKVDPTGNFLGDGDVQLELSNEIVEASSNEKPGSENAGTGDKSEEEENKESREIPKMNKIEKQGPAAANEEHKLQNGDIQLELGLMIAQVNSTATTTSEDGNAGTFDMFEEEETKESQNVLIMEIEKQGSEQKSVVDNNEPKLQDEDAQLESSTAKTEFENACTRGEFGEEENEKSQEVAKKIEKQGSKEKFAVDNEQKLWDKNAQLESSNVEAESQNAFRCDEFEEVDNKKSQEVAIIEIEKQGSEEMISVDINEHKMDTGVSIAQRQPVSRSKSASDATKKKSKQQDLTLARQAKPNAVSRWIPSNKGSYTNSMHVYYPPSRHSAPASLGLGKNSTAGGKKIRSIHEVSEAKDDDASQSSLGGLSPSEDASSTMLPLEELQVAQEDQKLILGEPLLSLSPTLTPPSTPSPSPPPPPPPYLLSQSLQDKPILLPITIPEDGELKPPPPPPPPPPRITIPEDVGTYIHIPLGPDLTQVQPPPPPPLSSLSSTSESLPPISPPLPPPTPPSPISSIKENFSTVFPPPPPPPPPPWAVHSAKASSSHPLPLSLDDNSPTPPPIASFKPSLVPQPPPPPPPPLTTAPTPAPHPPPTPPPPPTPTALSGAVTPPPPPTPTPIPDTGGPPPTSTPTPISHTDSPTPAPIHLAGAPPPSSLPPLPSNNNAILLSSLPGGTPPPCSLCGCTPRTPLIPSPLQKIPSPTTLSLCSDLPPPTPPVPLPSCGAPTPESQPPPPLVPARPSPPSPPMRGAPPPPPPPEIGVSPPPPPPPFGGPSAPPPPPPPPFGGSSAPPPPPPPFGGPSAPPPPPPPPFGGPSAPPPPPPPPFGGSSAPPPPPPPPFGGSSAPPPPPPPFGGSSAPPPPPPPFGGPSPPPPPPSIMNGPPPPPIPHGLRVPGPPAPPGPPLINGPGPPGPPPPLLNGKGRGISRPVPRKSTLKPLHWVKVTRALQGSLWDELQRQGGPPVAPEFDVSEIETLFSATAPKNTGKGGGQKTTQAKPTKVTLVDIKRANNVEIMLTKVKMPLPDMMAAALALDESVLDADQVENLIKFCPKKEEMELIKAYPGDIENLGKCEQFFLELMKVPRVESKLRVFLFKIQFNSQVADFRNSLTSVNAACEEVRNSTKLKEILKKILVLGNTLNQGTARGAAVGFKLDSLLKLTETRSSSSRMTLMHYLCKVIASKTPEILDFHKDLVNLEASSKIQLKALAEEMQSINKGLEKVKQELAASENDGPVSEVFHKRLKEFVGAAEAEVSSVTNLYSVAGKNADALALYFGEDPAKCQLEQVTSTLLNFVKLFQTACEENIKQAEEDKKKAQKEAEMAMQKEADKKEAEKKEAEKKEAEKKE